MGLSCKDWFFSILFVNFGLDREVMLEKQLTGHRVDRSICDWFWGQAISQGDSFKVPVNYFLLLLLFLDRFMFFFWFLDLFYHQNSAL